MGALKLPQVLTYSRANAALCHRIGVKLDGVDQAAGCIAYNVPEGYVIMQADGSKKTGLVEPYWRR
jgi:hypothetical protein